MLNSRSVCFFSPCFQASAPLSSRTHVSDEASAVTLTFVSLLNDCSKIILFMADYLIIIVPSVIFFIDGIFMRDIGL